MIESLHIKNFQSHNDSFLKFHAGLNVIVGDSDKGKSAILRSLYWILTNRPSGISIVSDWARDAKGKLTDEASAEMTTSDCVIKRLRTADFNGYEVNGVALEAVGVAVPDEVAAAAKIDDVNIQRQMDAPFMLGMSAGEVARYLNKTIKLDEIDACMSVADTRRKETLREHKALSADLDKIRAQLTNLAWIEDAQSKINQHTGAQSDLDRTLEQIALIQAQLGDFGMESARVDMLDERITKGSELLERHKSLSERAAAILEHARQLSLSLDEHSDAAAARMRSDFASNAESIMQALESRVRAYTSLCESSELLERSLKSYAVQKNAADVDTADAELLLNRHAKLTDKLTALNSELSKLQDSVAVYGYTKEDHTAADALIAELIAKIPDTCPACKQQIGDKNAICAHS